MFSFWPRPSSSLKYCFELFFLKKKEQKNVAPIDGIKINSIQVAAPYTKREDPRKTPTTLVAYKKEGQQTATMMNLTNEKNLDF